MNTCIYCAASTDNTDTCSECLAIQRKLSRRFNSSPQGWANWRVWLDWLLTTPVGVLAKID